MVTSVAISEPATRNPPRLRPPGLQLKSLSSFPTLLMVLLAAIIFLVLPRTNGDPDIGWHLRNAQYQLQHHLFLRQDLYSFTTAGKPWMDHEWLAEIPFYLGWKWFGPRGIFFVTYAAVTMTLLGIFALAKSQSHSARAAFLISIPAIVLASVSFGPRTLLFGWLCLIAELAILDRFGDQPDLLWLLPPLFLVWINTHGSWLIGLAVLALFALSGCVQGSWGAIHATRWTRPQARRLALATALSLAALCINPYGWRLVAYPFDLAFHQKLNIANVIEWRSVDFHAPRGKIVLALLLGAIVLNLARRRKWSLFDLMLLLLGLYAGLTYSRFLFLAAILILPFLARDIAGLIPSSSGARDRHWLNAAIMAVTIAAIGLHFPSNRQLLHAESAQFPDRAQVYLEHFHPDGNVLNDYLWGGYVEWNLRQIPVFVDSRVDVFEHNGVFKDYLDITHLHGSLELLGKYHIRYVLFSRKAPLCYLLEHTPGWRILYQDETTMLFERTRLPAKGSK